ncbi:hypothetical protein GpartN1_g4335.t1 [Galdieria partita]|uniref:Chorismate synthase n=1 Tax=Galdieria partita TaxID=83374 RepID=A0A9C7PYK8_9RHOD|nr:hypothetical protein GpartN1_g4335.t1 [Galdieria partita]
MTKLSFDYHTKVNSHNSSYSCLWINPLSSSIGAYTTSFQRIRLSKRGWERIKVGKYCLQTSYKLFHTRFYMGNGNSFGRCFRISTWGESHGAGVGVTVDGCPPQLPLTVDDIQRELDRRRPGQSRIVTPRKEQDEAEILSGVVDGQTLGTPIAILVRNQDQRPQDYDTVAVKYRPSHADATYDAKYGTRAVAGGGRSSARETIGRVAAGAIAKKILATYCNMEILGYVQRVKDIAAIHLDPDKVTLEQIEKNIVRCPDERVAQEMIELIDKIRRSGDSLGGVVECIVRNVPAGLGSPVFDKLEAELAKACMSLPASKGFEIGSGFSGTYMTGSEHNDEFYIDSDGRTRTRTNRSGGIQGGISNGENIILRVAFKPTSTIGKVQKTVSTSGEEVELRGKGRHDPCVLPRAVPMVEAMVALVMVDQLMQQIAQSFLPFRRESIAFHSLGKELFH